MVWQYRTILFEFTKDGLLGDRYVDDEEMEKTLNQMGQDSWELVDVSLLQDGLLAFLKRTVDEEAEVTGPMVQEPLNQRIPQRPVEPQVSREIPAMVEESRLTGNRPPISGRNPISSEPSFDDEAIPRRSFERPTRSRKEQDDNDGVGGIRIS
ncbi:MAG: DUF4177 domain-containing protein [Desulfobulbus sp.]|nr:DUF4177 domain-containing protein [Desulfobulbus sp.]